MKAGGDIPPPVTAYPYIMYAKGGAAGRGIIEHPLSKPLAVLDLPWIVPHRVSLWGAGDHLLMPAMR